MGWDFYTDRNMDKKDLVECILRDYTRYGTVHASSVRGNRLWFVYTDTKSNQKCILLALLKKNDGCWGYKILDEAMGMYYYDCPLKFLTMQPTIYNDYDQQWRESVLANKKSKPQGFISKKGFTPNDFEMLKSLMGIA